VGKKLIERAVQFAERHGKNGRLTLTDMSKPREVGGKTFYDVLGFNKVPGEELMKKLNPNVTADKWVKKPGKNLWSVK
jgi:GNAT superfamily N-acetyltransferase